MPHSYESKYPNLAARFSAKANIGLILEVIEKQCDHLFNLSELEGIPRADWSEENNYLSFLTDCIEHSGEEYTENEIKARLLPYISEVINSHEFAIKNFSLPESCTQSMGLWEKFTHKKLESDLSKNDVLKNYAFTTLDMARTASRQPQVGHNARVLELRHADYLKQSLTQLDSNRPLYIRSTSGDKRGLSQWILLYSRNGKRYLYSESPISEVDKLSLQSFLGNPLPEIEGGTSALSMSSGIRTVAHHIQTVGGAGLSSSADYFSLLIEWVWYTSAQHPNHPNWHWQYFKENTLQWNKLTHEFSLLNFNQKIGGVAADNEHLQMRSYHLGLDHALADPQLNILTVDKQKSTVTLNLRQPIDMGNMRNIYISGNYGGKAAYNFYNHLLEKRTSFGVASIEHVASALVLNIFRACAKEKNLVIHLPQNYVLDADEKALICYLMEMNPFVCELKNPENNASLTEINDSLQHIFARNRWLAINDYLPPLLDEFWLVAAEYWVAFLKTSPDLLSDNEEVKEFKRCVKEMGVHGLTPLLNYLIHNENELKPVFNNLLKNIDSPPVFYAGCAPKDIKMYTQSLIQHLERGNYFPFKQFQFSFVPGVNGDILKLLSSLNQLKYFDKISLTDCLTTVAAKNSLKTFLREAITLAEKNADWVCPIHIPELEKPINDRDGVEIARLYEQLNNILIKRTRTKYAKELFDVTTFKMAESSVASVSSSAASSHKVAAKVSKEKDGLVGKFNHQVGTIWDDRTELSLARSGGISLQMQQQQQIQQERSRCLDNEMEHGSAYEDVLPSLLIDYSNIDKNMGDYYNELLNEGRIDRHKMAFHNGKPLQNFFHTWVSANPLVAAEHTIQKMTPYAAKMLLKFHRQLSGGLNVSNLPRGFYTQRMASGEMVLGYKSTLGHTTDHNPLTMQLTNAIPKVERVLGNFEQFSPANQKYAALYLCLFAQMQPEITVEEAERRYDEFEKSEYLTLSPEWRKFFDSQPQWICANWEIFYSSSRSSFKNDPAVLETFRKSVQQAKPYIISQEDVLEGLLFNTYKSPEQQEHKRALQQILLRQENFEYARPLGQIYSQYGDYGLERFSNLILSMEKRLSSNFTDHFFKHYLRNCATFSPLLQERSLDALDEMIHELGDSEQEKHLFMEFLDLQMKAVDWDDISMLWKGFRYFYSHIKDMGLEEEFIPGILHSIAPKNQNMFPCFERILKSLEHIPNQELRKQLVIGLKGLDLSEGGVAYAVCHDGFSIVEPDLELSDFRKGAPTYVAPMSQLYAPSWTDLYTLRALASTNHIKPVDYALLKKGIKTKSELIWALHTDWNSAKDLMDFVRGSSITDDVARHFYHIFYQNNQSYKRYPLEIFKLINSDVPKFKQVLNKYPEHLTFFDSVKLLAEKPEDLPRIYDLFLAPGTPTRHPHLEQGLLLASVLGVTHTELAEFYNKTTTLKQVTRNELVILTQQLLSLNLASLPNDEVARKAIWQGVLVGIQSMNERPLEVDVVRKELMQKLKEEHHLTFKSSIAGDYRFVIEGDLANLGLDQFFEQHSGRIKALLTKHIAVSEIGGVEEQLKPLIEFLKRLQLNKTYINEVEPLLATLESVLEKHPNGCWTATYFNEFLRALQPQDNKTGFPMSVLEALLTEQQSPLMPAAIDEIQPHFDSDGMWRGIWGSILAKGETFTRAQQAKLTRLSVRCMNELAFIPTMVEVLAHSDFDGLRDVIINRLLKSGKTEQLQAIFDQCVDWVRLPHQEISAEDWKSTCHLWIDVLTQKPELESLLLNEQLNKLESPVHEWVLHIIAYSSFPSHHYPTMPRSDYFKGGERSKVVKLAQRLATLSEPEIKALSACYPGKPAPDTRDLLGFIKNKDKQPIDGALQKFLTEQQAVMRQDYQQLTTSRESDLARLLELTYVTRGTKNEPISASAGIKLTLMFQYLKQIEQGSVIVGKSNKPLSKMTQEELQQAFRECSQALAQDPDNAQLKTQVWAVLFEALGKTTEKYPHLAQQFALIANDELLAADPSSILQLKTGEGKSHFIAMRAARHVGAGKKVDVCTAKWSLAERDLLDYKQFFDYLGIKTTNVHARSSRDTYLNADVVYTTPGDLSLFLDEQASQGTPVPADKVNRVGLGDEFDFLFYEGQKTQFNYARHTGITPKEMSWFYRGLNEFYDQKFKDKGANFKIPPKLVAECYDFLASRANDDGRLYLDHVTPMTMLSWLQSAHEAAIMKMGINYTVRLEQVAVGEEEFPLQEIYPLTKDMQAAVGSTFSHGVHQLLAERLNAEAKLQSKAQNYHVHPESDIISSQVFSQRLKTLWNHWEGFTGTVSTSQASELNTAYHTAVLRVPTNQKDLRRWAEPHFFNTEEELEIKMAQDIRARIKNKRSIFLCGASDAEVKKNPDMLQKYFTKEEMEQHFLSYTNESHDTPAEILRKKRKMEGDYLGQKEHGVVLNAAGFGRGDNLGIYATMLRSIHDLNDLGQKGGRAARNGEEGEVLQYYLIDEINNELVQSLRALQQGGLLEDIAKKTRLPLVSQFLHHEGIDPKNYDSKTKFNLLLQLREYIAAIDNYPSRVYHETKAMLSSEGIRLIGMAPPENKELLIKGFADYLGALEKKWMELQTKHKNNTQACIKELDQFIKDNISINGRLTELFKIVGTVSYQPDHPNVPEFVPDKSATVPTVKESLMSAAQGLLLKLTDVPADLSLWNKLIDSFAKLNELQLQTLLHACRDKAVLHFDAFQHQIEVIAEKHSIADVIQHNNAANQRDVDAALKGVLSSDLTYALSSMPEDVSQMALSWILAPGLADPKNHIARVAPMLRYSSKNPEVSLSFWNNAALRDELLDLPAECFTGPVYVNAGVLCDIKKLLDSFMASKDAQYVSLFQQLVRGMEHQSEQRKRLLGQYEGILSNTKKPKEQLLRQIATVAEHLKSEEHFTLLKKLIEKMSIEYKKPRVTIEALDGLWDDLLQSGVRITEYLPLLEANLAQEGKEFASLMHEINRLDTDLIVLGTPILHDLFYKNAKGEKKQRIEDFTNTLDLIQETFAGKLPQAKEIFTLFKEFLVSPSFYESTQKKALFASMKQLINLGLKEQDLFPKYVDHRKTAALLYSISNFPKHTTTLLSLEPFIDYVVSRGGQISPAEVEGMKLLLDKTPDTLKVEALATRLKEFNHTGSTYDLLYLCQRFPNYTTILLSLEPLASYLKSPHYQGLSDGAKERSLVGIKVLLDRKLESLDAGKIMGNWVALNDIEKEKLLFLFSLYPQSVRKNSVEDFTPWAQYLAGSKYAGLSDTHQEHALLGIHCLLAKGQTIFTAAGGIKSFAQEEMTELLHLAHRFPQHADKALILRPLIELLTPTDEQWEKEVMRVSIGNLMTHLKLKSQNFDAALARVQSFTESEKARLVEFSYTLPEDGVNVMFTNLITRTGNLFTPEQSFVIQGFYKNKADLGKWVSNELMRMSSAERVTLMKLLKEGDFVSVDPSFGTMKFAASANTDLFEAALNAYKKYIDSEFTKPKSRSQARFRGMSAEQQGSLNAVMKEFKEIGLAPPPLPPRPLAGAQLPPRPLAGVQPPPPSLVEATVAGEIQKQIDAYEHIIFKDNKRYEQIKYRIHGLSDLDADDSLNYYVELLTEIRSIKSELMRQDVEKASMQLFPTLHFSGQSRLYRMLNHIEDLVLKSWTEDARHQHKAADHFADISRESRDEYIQSFRLALAVWKYDRPNLFKGSSDTIYDNICSLDNDEVVKYLKDNPKLINNLSGTLRAIAKEILVHDADIIKEINTRSAGM
ncbi:MAG: hypothetical protein P4L65_05440 [Legionella sp.]|nr:hypothetical protein [Legionella sp.]